LQARPVARGRAFGVKIGPNRENGGLSGTRVRIGMLSAFQLPVKAWHTYLDDPTLADAILDCIVHSSHKIEIKGVSLRDPGPGK